MKNFLQALIFLLVEIALSIIFIMVNLFLAPGNSVFVMFSCILVVVSLFIIVYNVLNKGNDFINEIEIAFERNKRQ